MDVSAAYIYEKPASKDLLPFVIFGGVTLVFSFAGVLLHIPLLGILPPLLLIAALLVKSPTGLLIILFGTFSVAIHISVFTPDSAMLILLACYWLINRGDYRLGAEPYKWQRRFAWANLSWISIIFIWHFADFGASGLTVGTGLRLIFYYLMFIVVLDVTKDWNKDHIIRVFRWAWLFAIIVTAIAVYQHYVLGQSRVFSILEGFHAHLGNYAIGAAMVCGIMTIWSERPSMKLFGIVTIFLSILALIVSETRSDMLGIAVGLVLFGLLRGVRGIIAVGLIVGVLLGSGVASHVLQKEESLTFQEQTQQSMTKTGEKANYDPSSVDRVFVWLGILSMEQQANTLQIMTGIGPGNFYDFMRPYMTLHAFYTGIPGNSINGAHDNYLELLVELGAGGLALFVLFITGILETFWKMRKRNDKRVNITANIAIAGTVALLVSGFTQETFYAQPAMGNFMGFYVVTIALLMNLTAEKKVLKNA